MTTPSGAVAAEMMRVYTRISKMDQNTLACHCTALRRASRALTDTYDRSLEPVGLSLPQFSLLRNLERERSQSVTALARAVRLERTTLGRNLQVLERRRWVVSGPSPEDQRERLVTLTAAGRGVLARAVPLWNEAQGAVERRVGSRRLAVLREILAELEAGGP